MKDEKKENVEAVQKRITEICNNAIFCDSIDISVHIKKDELPKVTYTISEYCVPDRLIERCCIDASKE